MRCVLRRTYWRVPALVAETGTRCDSLTRATEPPAGVERWRASRHSGEMWREHREGYAARHDTALRLLAGIGRAAVEFDLDGARYFRLCRPSAKPARFPTRAGPVSSGTHAMVAVPDVDASRARCWSLTIIVRSSAGNAESAGPHGRRPRSTQAEQFLHYRRDCEVV